MALRELQNEELECILCKRKTIDEVEYGPLLEKDDIVVHYYCLLFSGIEQNGRDQDGIYGYIIEEIVDYLLTIEDEKCCYCSGNKASIKCAKPKCTAIFHYPCALENGSLHQFMGRFNSFCGNHKPKQKITKKVLEELKKNPRTCLICFDIINCEEIDNTIWATCCRSAWYHKNCVRRLALSSGSLLKCVICRDSTRFKNVLRRYGVYVPRRDASWETVPGAFQELYVRHNECDEPQCKCPFGRSHVDENWELLLCDSCGSQGIHVQCLEQLQSRWECETCQKVSRKKMKFN